MGFNNASPLKQQSVGRHINFDYFVFSYDIISDDIVIVLTSSAIDRAQVGSNQRLSDTPIHIRVENLFDFEMKNRDI
jgi:hypothetical protein